MLLAMALIVAAVAAMLVSTPPAARPADAPAAVFASERAMVDVRAVGRAPHPAGSRAHADVRDYLMGRMAVLGLAPRVATVDGMRIEDRPAGVSVTGARVENIVGVLRGRDARLPAALLMAHYDSVPASPGAADDGAGIAAALEIVRALRTTGAGARDLILLFSDAEEKGLLGARAFFAGDPAAGRVGFVINMDMRGGGGRAIMHETGRDAGGAIALFRHAAVHPTTDSIAAWVERLIRNSSDFRVAVDQGLPGLNYAILDRQFDYHAASSTPDRLDPRSLQHLGEQVLAVTRVAVDGASLPSPSADPAYASMLGLFVLVWPTWAGWIVIAAALTLAGLAWRRDRPKSVGQAALAALYLMLTMALALMLVRAGTGIPFGFTVGRPLLAWWPVYETAIGLVCVAGVLLWHGATLAGRRIGAVAVPLVLALIMLALGAGGWIVVALAAVAALIAAPAFAVPLRAGAAGYGLLMLVALTAVVVQSLAPIATPSLLVALLGGGVMWFAAARDGVVLPWIVAVSAGLLAAQQAATAHLLLLAVGETIAAIAAPFALFAVLAVSPLLTRGLSARIAVAGGVLLAAVAIGLIGTMRFVDPASPDTPAVSQVIHVSDLATGRFYRVTSLLAPDRWTRAALGPAKEAPLPPVFDQALVARGEAVRQPRPQVRLARLADGRLLLTAQGPPGTRELRMALDATVAMRSVQVNGVAAPLLVKPGRIDRLVWSGREPSVSLLLAPRGHGRLVTRLSFLADGWPAGARPLPPRPPGIMPWYDSDAHILLDTVQITW